MPRKLNLSDNNIRDEALVYLISTFLSSRLTELDLSFNHISTTSMIMLDKMVLEYNFGERYKDHFHASCKFWVCKKPYSVEKIKGKVCIEHDFIKIIEEFVFAQGELITECCKPLIGEEGSEAECSSLG